MENLVMMNSYKNVYGGKRVLVTGHTGFKGSWFCIWLQQLGAEVYGYALPPLSKDNFVACRIDQVVNHKIGDICNEQDLSTYFTQVQPDIAFHFAAQSLVLKSYNNPRQTFQTNLMGVVNFFEAVRKTKSVKVAINITSDKCYDNREWIWGYRENDPMGGTDPYSASKGCAELITNSYLKSFFVDKSGCKISSARAGNVIGGGDWSDDRIVPDFFRSMEEQKTLFVRNPNATRPWQHVLEPLSGYLTLGSVLFNTNDSNLCGAWNFGPLSSNNYDVKFLIEKIIDYCKMGNCDFSAEKAVLHEAVLLKLDISKAINILKWQPILDIYETIEYTVNGYLDQLNGKDLLNARIAQINSYTKRAEDLGISWATN